jgi:hypothetical protein
MQISAKLNALVAMDWVKAATANNLNLTLCVAADNKGRNLVFATHKIKKEDLIECLEQTIKSLKGDINILKVVNEKTFKDGKFI